MKKYLQNCLPVLFMACSLFLIPCSGWGQKAGIKLKAAKYITAVSKKETEEVEKESAAIEEKHRRTLWFTLLQKKHPEYFKVKELFVNYFKNNKEEESKPKEVCASWLKTQIFYLDNKIS